MCFLGNACQPFHVDKVWICRVAGSVWHFFRRFRRWFLALLVCWVMSVLDDFARMRLYGTRASEFELLAETEPLREVRFRYRIIARHYRELANREEQSDKARMAPAGCLFHCA